MATAVTRIMPMIFSAMPARIIFGIVNNPDPNTIALGGVATGSINAQLAANVTGTVTSIGSKPGLNRKCADYRKKCRRRGDIAGQFRQKDDHHCDGGND